MGSLKNRLTGGEIPTCQPEIRKSWERLFSALELAMKRVPFQVTVVLHFFDPFGLDLLVPGGHVA